MKLSDYAKQQGVRYETAWRWFRDGKIKGHRVGEHTILVDEGSPSPAPRRRVAVYARVCSSEKKSNLESQAERLVAYCTAKGYQMAKVVKEVGSGIHDSRPKLAGFVGRSRHHAHCGGAERPTHPLWFPLSGNALAWTRTDH